MGYLKHSIRGVTWVALLRGFTRGIAFFRIAILARLLSPSQIGLFGVASLVLAFVEVLTETGVNVVLVQHEKEINKYISTAWIVSIARGFVIAVAIWISAPFVAHFFFQGNAAIVLILLIGIVPLIRGFINPSVVIFQKELQFKTEFYYKSAVFIIDSASAVLFVFLLQSSVGIVLGLIVGAITELILSFIIARPLPTLKFNKAQTVDILHRGKWITFAGVFNYLYHNFDDIVIGRIMGVYYLGLYGMAYKISTLPISEVADVVARVIFPVYVKIAGDRARLWKAFVKTTLVVSALSIPLGLACMAFPREIISVVLGDKWISAWPALQVLGLFGIIRSISGITTSVFLAVNKQEYVAVVTFVSFVALAASIVPLVLNYGIVGGAIASVIGALASLPFMLFYTRKVLFRYEKS